MTVRTLLAVEQLRRTVPGGVGRYASALLDELARSERPPAHGVTVTLLASRAPRRHGTPGQQPGRSSGPADPLERWGFGVRASRLPGPWLTRAWDRGVVRAPAGFDVVHSISLAAPPLRHRWAAAGHHGAAMVVTVHDLTWRAFPEATTRRGRQWHEAALRRALRRADAFVVPSQPVADELVDAGAPRDAVTVLRWGADHLPLPDLAGAAELLRGLGVTGPYLLSAGTLEPRKNLRRLAAAYVTARPSLPEPWPLVVVGPTGWGEDQLDAVSGRRAPVPGVVPVGLVSDGVLAGLYQGARLFAYVPLIEGYGLPPLEAMTFGVPVVVSTGVPSVAPQAGAPPVALRVDPLATGEIADALVAAAGNEALRTSLSAGGAALAGSRKWCDVAAHHVMLWEALHDHRG